MLSVCFRGVQADQCPEARKGQGAGAAPPQERLCLEPDVPRGFLPYVTHTHSDPAMARLRAIINDFSETIAQTAKAGGTHGMDFYSLEVDLRRIPGQSTSYYVYIKLVYSGSSITRSDSFQV